MVKVVTANLLTTGTVVYLDAGNRWVSTLAEAAHFAGTAEAEAGLERAKLDERQAIIVDPFLTPVGDRDATRPVLTLRDRIRAYGPTISYGPAANARAVEDA